MLSRKGMLLPVNQIVAPLQKTARSYGLPMGDIRKIFNTRLIQELGLWAQEKGRGPAFQAEGFNAYFVENANISDRKNLMMIVRRAGLDMVEAENVLNTGRYSSAVNADWHAVDELEIVAAPTYICGEARLVGAQSYESLVTLVVQNGARNRSGSAN